MIRSTEELEELVRALETVWVEQSERADALQREAADLWRARADQERTIGDLRREIEALRVVEPIQMHEPSSPDLAPDPIADAPELRSRLTRQRDTIAQRMRELANFREFAS